MKTKLKFFLVLLAMLMGGVDGAWAANIYEFYSHNGITNTRGYFGWNQVFVYNDNNDKDFSQSTTLADGSSVDISKALKINDSNRYIRFTTSTTSTVYVSIVITDDAITGSYHDFQLDEDHRNNGNVYPKNTVNTQTFSDITPGTHTIKSSSGGIAVYYVKVVENSFNNSYPYTWDFASNWGTETAAALNPTSYWELVSGSTTVVENVSNFIDSAFGYLWKGNSTSHPNIDKTDGIQFKASHPHLKLCPGQWIQGDASVSFKLLSVPANSLITIYTTSVDAGFSSVVNAAGKKIDGVYKYAVTAQNDVTFNFKGTTQITKISVTTLDPSEGFLAFDKETDTYNLVDLSYTEPTLTVLPVGTSVTWSIDKYQVANFRETSNTGHDLLIVNTGEVNVTASITTGGQTYTASYKLNVIADEAVWDVRDGNECYFPTSNTKQGAPSGNNNTGKLLVRKVTSVPHITMEFGDVSNSNMAMVAMRNGDSGAGTVRAANLIDENGWQHVWVENQGDYTMKPHQGTFYIFKPSISGKLTIKGIRKETGSGANTVVLVDANASTGNTWPADYSAGKRTRYYEQITQNGTTTEGAKYYSYIIVKTLSFATEGTYATTEEQVDLIGGHTYYLYANTPRTRGHRAINRDANPTTDETIGDGSNSWQNFYLTGFKYETTFKFNKQNVVMGNTTGVKAPGYNHIADDTDEYTQTINDAGEDENISYSCECRGNISCNIESNTGRVYDISGSGAIVVKATLTEGEGEGRKEFYTYYVLTKPYTTITGGGIKRWVFTTENDVNQMELVSELKSNAPATEWGIEYKVRRYDTKSKALDYINVPVLTNALEVNGDNARYIGTTAGLLFDADVSAFGTNTSVQNNEYKSESLGDGVGKVYKKVNGNWVEQTSSADIDNALRTLLNLNASDAVDPCYNVTMENGTSMTIPNLKEGQYVRIKWSRYSRNQGDRVGLSNLKDLNGTLISGSLSTDPGHIDIGAGGNVDYTGGTGYHEFRVAADGDVTITLEQNGWANIYEIDVANEFIPTDLRLMHPETWGTYDDGTPKELSWSEVATTHVRKKGTGEAISQTLSTQFGGTHSQSNTAVTYSIKDGSHTGTLSSSNSSVSDSKTLNVSAGSTGGHGRFTLVQEGRVTSLDNTNIRYLLDRNEYEIKVYEYDYGQKPYPWTWNMENMSTATATALSTDNSLTDGSNNYKTWKSDVTGKYQLTLEPENVISWSTKSTIDGSQTAISELDGLGIRPADITKTNTIVLGSNNTGIELPSSQNEEIITVPSVPNFHTAYIRVKKGSSGIVTAKYTSAGIINDQELTMVSDDGTYTVYKAEGGGKVSDGNAHIIDFYLKDATVLQAAVSKDDKTVTAAGYATEAREYPLDFTLANTFGVNNGLSGANQKAYIVTGVDGENVTLQEVSYLPTGAGVMMGSGVTSGSTEWPLFTTDVNRTTDVATNAVVRTEDGSGVSYTTVDMSANKLIGVITDPESRENVDQTTVVGGDTYYNYMLSAGGYVLKRTNDIWTVDMNDEINAVGFYLVIKEGTRLSTGGTSPGGKPNKNSAYLQLEEELAVHQGIATPSGARPYFLLDFGDDATGLQQATTASSKKYGQNDAYYTLQGIRVDKPGKGLYLLNGKKVYVK